MLQHLLMWARWDVGYVELMPSLVKQDICAVVNARQTSNRQNNCHGMVGLNRNGTNVLRINISRDPFYIVGTYRPILHQTHASMPLRRTESHIFSHRYPLKHRTDRFTISPCVERHVKVIQIRRLDGCLVCFVGSVRSVPCWNLSATLAFATALPRRKIHHRWVRFFSGLFFSLEQNSRCYRSGRPTIFLCH